MQTILHFNSFFLFKDSNKNPEGICIDQHEIKRCDKELGDFDVGKDIVQNDNECNHFLLYQKCINSIVNKSKCDSKVKDIAIGYLESRVKIENNICKTVVKKFEEKDKEERILVESEMQSAVDSMPSKINFFCEIA